MEDRPLPTGTLVYLQQDPGPGGGGGGSPEPAPPEPMVIPFDAIPRIIPAAEWAHLQRGLVQIKT